MLIRFFSFFLLVQVFTLECEAQLQNYNWYFGNGGPGIKFNLVTKTPSPTSPRYSPYGNEGCSVVSSPATGKLFYYSDGIRAVDANHQVMPNGSGLNGQASSAQNGWSCLVPGECGRYYLFSNGAASEVIANGPLYYSIVDMSLPGNGTLLNPMGDIVSGKKNILLQSAGSEALTVVAGKTNNLYWLLTYQFNSSLINIYKITSSGIAFITTYNTGIVVKDPRNMRYSAAAGKISITGCIENDPVVVCNFDNATGIISNPFSVFGTPFNSTPANYYGTYDTEWSPNGTKLYISKYRWYPTTGAGRLYQYNLNTPTSVPVLLYDIPGDVNYGGKGLKIGPDDKIYWLYTSTSNFSQFLGVVSNPDADPVSLIFNPLGFNLGASFGNAHKLPEFLIYKNNPPTAINDMVSPCVNGTIKVDVLNNDSDQENDKFSPVILKNPSHGTAVLLPDSSIQYTGNVGYVGKDTIMYVVCDNACFPLCDTAMVVMDVCSVPCMNQKPVAQNDSLINCIENNTNVKIAIMNNDSDPEGDLLSPSIFKNPAHGTGVILSDNSVKYTPDAGYIGKDTFTYVICDNGCNALCDTAIVTMNICTTVCVNQAPDAQNDYLPSCITNRGVKIAVMNNDSDPEGDLISPSIFKNPAHGTALLSNNTIKYTPNVNYIGKDTITYVLCDNGCNPLCDIAMVIMNVCASPCINEKPIAQNDSLLNCIKDGVDIKISVLDNDSDPDLDSIKIVKASALSGGVSVISNKEILYNSILGFSGVDIITYVVCDSICNGQCDTASVSVCVNAIDLFIPNLITRNNDNQNDNFRILGLYPQSSLKVYNSWGEMIFESDDYKNNWSGRNESDGIYFYYLKDPIRKKNWKGWVHLIH